MNKNMKKAHILKLRMKTENVGSGHQPFLQMFSMGWTMSCGEEKTAGAESSAQEFTEVLEPRNSSVQLKFLPSQ